MSTIQSKYLEQFQRAGNTLRLRGNRVLLELLPKPEVKSKGGLVLATSLNDHRATTEQNMADICVVLATGEGYYNDDGTVVPLDLMPGNVVLVSRYGLKLYSNIPGLADYTGESIAIARDTDVHAVWKSAQEFERYIEALNAP
jgi:co-chaperonin GroES (HSP10)